MVSRLLTIALSLACALVLTAADDLSAFDNDEATGYRFQNYRSPVTLPVEGGRRVDLAEVDRLAAEGASLVDVMPQRGGYDPQTGHWRIVDKRETIPGAVWLPNVGAGKLDARTAAYFASELSKLSRERKDHKLVFFCMADCWMSWNAVKRAAELGYTQVYWFADGTDGWTEADRALVEANPPPVPALEAH